MTQFDYNKYLEKELKETKEDIKELIKRVYAIEKELDLQERGIKNNIDIITEVAKDVEEIKDKPNKRETQIITTIITGIVSALVAYIISKIN